MSAKKESARIIYESALGQPIRAYQWRELRSQMKAANMPLTPKNLQFVAKCKLISPRKKIAAEVLELVANSGTELSGQVLGAQIKKYVFEKCPNISRDKFYRAFREEGNSYRNEKVFDISRLGEVLYRIFS